MTLQGLAGQMIFMEKMITHTAAGRAALSLEFIVTLVTVRLHGSERL